MTVTDTSVAAVCCIYSPSESSLRWPRRASRNFFQGATGCTPPPQYKSAITLNLAASAARRLRVLGLAMTAASAMFATPLVAAHQQQVLFNTDVGLVQVQLSNGARLAVDLATGDSLVTMPDGSSSTIPYSSLDAAGKQHIAEITLAAGRRENSFVMNSWVGQPVDPRTSFSPLFAASKSGSGARTTSSGCLSHLPCTGSGKPSWTNPGPFPPANEGEWGNPYDRPITPRDLEDYDRERWEAEKDKACRARDLALVGVAATGVAAVLSCVATASPAVVTGAPAVICGASLIGLAASAVSAYDSHQECSVETYPGRRNW